MSIKTYRTNKKKHLSNSKQGLQNDIGKMHGLFSLKVLIFIEVKDIA